MNELDRADIHAPRRLTDKEKVGITLDFPREDDLLLVAAREVLGRQRRDRGADVEPFHLALAVLKDRGVVHQKGVLLIGRIVVIAEGDVLPRGKIHDHAKVLAILGHMGDASGAARLPVGMAAGEVKVLAVQPDRPGRGHDAAEDGEEFGLTVPGDTGDAEDLPLADGEGDTLDPLHLVLVHDAEVFDLKDDAAGIGGAFGDVQQDLAPDHQLGQLLRVGFGGLDRRRHLAAPHDRHRVGDLHDLAQLVGDEDDGLALLLQPAQDAEEVVGLIRRQDARGFVEDQDVGVAVKRLEDLHPLLVADAEFLDHLVGIDV